MDLYPKAPDEELQGRVGVHMVATQVMRNLGWIFRETTSTDLGIDGEIELREKDGTSHGRRLSLQIKCGKSYLKEQNDTRITYRGDYKHLKYWTEFPDPVLIIICDPEKGHCWWQYVDLQNVNFHEHSWSIEVPKNQTLCLSSKMKLEGIAKLYQKKDAVELLLRDWFGWRFTHKMEFASDFSIPRDYHWLSMLGQVEDKGVMIDYLLADLGGFPYEEIEDIVKYAESNARVFGYKYLTVAFISESRHHLKSIPTPPTIPGVSVAFVPFLMNRRSLQLNEVSASGALFDNYEYEYSKINVRYMGEQERAIKYSGNFCPYA